jgi:hypothetical protein
MPPAALDRGSRPQLLSQGGELGLAVEHDQRWGGQPGQLRGHRRPVLTEVTPEQVGVLPAPPRRPGAAGQPQRHLHPVFVRPGAGAGALEHHHIRGRVPGPQGAVGADQQCCGIGQRVVGMPRRGGGPGQLTGQLSGAGETTRVGPCHRGA